VKKNPTISPDFRVKADAAVTAWRDTAANCTATQAECSATCAAIEKARSPGGSLSLETGLQKTVAQIAALEAEDKEKATRFAASIAVHVADVADGDADAVACDVARLHEDLVTLLAEEDRIRTELKAAEQRSADRVTEAHAAMARYATRRAVDELPAPVALPYTPMPSSYSGRDDSPRGVVKALVKRLADGPPAPQTNAERLRPLLHEERETRAKLELLHRERLQQKADAERYERERQADALRAREKARAEAAEFAAKSEAERKRVDDLVAAQRAREASGAAR
jgi:hypothetical protein